MASNLPTNPFPVPDPSTILENVTEAIPGAGFILDLVKAVAPLPALVEKFVADAVIQHPIDTLTQVLKFAEHAGTIFEIGQITFWDWMSNISFGAMFAEMLELGLGVKISEFTDEEKAAVETVDTMLGFATVLPFAVAGINAAGEAIFAGRWPKSIHEALKELPTEMGMSWALGLTIDESFKAAQGVILEEAINKQKRPNRIAWQQMRVLFKQHLATEDQLLELLKAQGYPDEQIALLMKLADAQVPVGDIQAMYLHEMIDSAQALDLIKQLGFGDKEADQLLELYISKAETAAGSQLRSTARQLFTNQLIGEDQYRTILTDSHFASREIDDDIRAINMVHDVGRTQQSVALVKSRYLHKLIPAETAIADLRTLNYSLQYASELVQSWDLPPIHPKHGLNQSKLLSYFISGLLTEAQLRDGLAALSVDQKTIDFLVANPSSANGARVLRLGPNMVLQAYVEGAVTDQQLPAMFKKVGVQPDDVPLWINKAVYRKSHTRGTTTYTTHLSAGEIIACFKWGLFDENTAHERLMQLGYSPDDATLKLEIENKGVFQPPVPPVFTTLGDAIAYLRASGYHVINPTDPKILAAEAMLAQAGYSWTMPTTPVPGDTFGGSGGGLTPPGGVLTPPGVPGTTPPPGPVLPPG